MSSGLMIVLVIVVVVIACYRCQFQVVVVVAVVGILIPVYHGILVEPLPLVSPSQYHCYNYNSTDKTYPHYRAHYRSHNSGIHTVALFGFIPLILLIDINRSR